MDNRSDTISPDHWSRRNTAGVTIASSLLFDDVSYLYGESPVVSGVTVRVEPGEVLCLLGPSGSGKTTLMRIAAGIENPASGCVWIDNRVVAGEGVSVPPEKRGIGLVFQDNALFPHLTILQNVLFGLKKFPKEIAETEARQILWRVGMERQTSLYPHQLSGGEQQRAALARALAPRPGILLLDEPFSGLDARLRDAVRDETIELLRDTRATSIIVTHDPEEALRVGDHIALMRDGRLVQHGTGEDLYYRPADLFTARFFSELNQFASRVVDGKTETPIGLFPAPGFVDGQNVVVCLRLANIEISPLETLAHDQREGRILSRRFVGIADLLEVALAGLEEPVRVRVKAGSLPADCTNVAIRPQPGTQMIFAQD